MTENNFSFGFVLSYASILCGCTIAYTLLWLYSQELLGDITKLQSIELFIVIALLTVVGFFGTIWYGDFNTHAGNNAL